ncbi:MAG TPA: universal stress protein [Acidimicrobiales bacterium]|nr:universal stress protein [Acidimicrobiales bacterium]
MAGRILVGVDGSEGSRHALRWAIGEGGVRDATVQAVIVWQTPYDFGEILYPVDEGKLAGAARDVLDGAVAAVTGGSPSERLETLVLKGDPAQVLCTRAGDGDLLVVGSRGHGTFAGLLLGSVSSKCAHHSPGPVVIVPQQALRGAPSARIVVGVDGSEGSRRALRWSVAEAKARGAAVEAISVWRGVEDPEMALEFQSFPTIGRQERALPERARQRVADAVTGAAAESATVKVEPLAVEGDPAQVLCSRSSDADLLVVGSRGHGTFVGLLLGSVSVKCAHHSRCPVVIVPSDERDDPSFVAATEA